MVPSDEWRVRLIVRCLITETLSTLKAPRKGWTLSGFSELSDSVVQATLVGHSDCFCPSVIICLSVLSEFHPNLDPCLAMSACTGGHFRGLSAR